MLNSLYQFLTSFIVIFLMSLQPIYAQWNNPYSADKTEQKTLFSSFSTPPKHLDPVRSYSSNEWAIISQIYEPPLQYHYFKRPYQLESLTLSKLPEVTYLNQQLQIIPEEEAASRSDEIAYSEYLFTLRDDVVYQPHPAFVKKINGEYRYHSLDKILQKWQKYPKRNAEKIDNILGVKSVSDFTEQSYRHLTSDDYIYAIKRMGLRQNHSPILDTMAQYIVGLKDFSEAVSRAYQTYLQDNQLKAKEAFFDLRTHQISGVQKISDHQFSIRIYGRYPQFLYWLSMNFFAPIPWEADRFYKQKLLIEKNITLDTSPVGTGAFYLVENNPNRRMRLLKNPNFHSEIFPDSGLSEDAPKELLLDAGKKLPLIDEVVYSLEKESVPLWNKFLQGYYDASGVSSESFDQAVSISSSGSLGLTDSMKQKGIQFLNAIQPSIMYFGFNMADPIVGGYSEQQRKLRQAISIAINFEEYISIFLNGRGLAAQGPIPPGIFGFQEGEPGVNSVVYEWKENRAQRKSLEIAKKLLAEAGYPEGKKADGTPLQLFYDTAATGPDSQSILNWYRKQFAKLGIELVIRATDYNRFQDKVRGAKVQMFSWGWNADYPDPENFLFLLYGGNATIHTSGSGINSSNYDNPEFNRLFEQIKNMPNTAERERLIREMIKILQQDAPWAWGFYPKSLALYHSWLRNLWPNAMANNTLKYRSLDAKERHQKQTEWNQPIVWPLILVVLLLIVSLYPLSKAYKKRQKTSIDVPVYDSKKTGAER